jgi:hypothetical protein
MVSDQYNCRDTVDSGNLLIGVLVLPALPNELERTKLELELRRKLISIETLRSILRDERDEQHLGRQAEAEQKQAIVPAKTLNLVDKLLDDPEETVAFQLRDDILGRGEGGAESHREHRCPSARVHPERVSVCLQATCHPTISRRSGA